MNLRHPNGMTSPGPSEIRVRVISILQAEGASFRLDSSHTHTNSAGLARKKDPCWALVIREQRCSSAAQVCSAAVGSARLPASGCFTRSQQCCCPARGPASTHPFSLPRK